MQKICANLIDLIKNILLDENFIERYKQKKKDFTRQRSLPFFTVVTFLFNLLKSSLQNELDRFFQTLSQSDVAERQVTASAFCQARMKLKHEAFIELNHRSTDYYYEHFLTQTWKGFRLVAVDGSMVQVPKNEATEAHFGAWHPAAGGSCPMARLSQMFDVLNHVTIDSIISPCEIGEQTLAAQHFDYLASNDLVLLDRNYPAFWLFQLMIAKGAHFCARLAVDQWTVVAGNFVATGLNEQVIEIQPTHEAKKKCAELELPISPIKIRLIRVELESGEIEVLATNLFDEELYPHAIFKELYHDRWPVEEQYKLLKSRIEIANFTGKSVEAVKQDFYARVFIANLTAMLASPVHEEITEKHKNSKLAYQINWTQALAKMKNSGILLFFREQVMDIIHKLHKLFLENVCAVRPGRTFPRKKSVKKRAFAFAYKPIS